MGFAPVAGGIRPSSVGPKGISFVLVGSEPSRWDLPLPGEDPSPGSLGSSEGSAWVAGMWQVVAVTRWHTVLTSRGRGLGVLPVPQVLQEESARVGFTE